MLKKQSLDLLHTGIDAAKTTWSASRPGKPEQAPLPFSARLLRALRKRPLFTFCVLLPTLLGAIYFGLIASDIYISESSFVIRTPQGSGSGGLQAVITGTVSGVSEAPADAAAVNQYILSRDALDFLNSKMDLRRYFSSPSIDFLHRFGMFGFHDGMEDLHEYYLRRVKVVPGQTSAISTLRVSVFSPEEAQQMNELLLQGAEQKVNQLNDRARADLIRYAETEVNEAEKRVMQAALALSQFRNTQEVVDPEKQTAFHFTQISKLQSELIETKTRIAQLRQLAPQSPAPEPLELKARTIQEEIDKELAKVVGGDRSLARLTADYEQFAIEREFAEQQLAISLSALQTARNEAQRQQIYLERISNPNLPDVALEPRRVAGVLTIFVFGLILWGVLSMLVSGVREHQNR